MIDPNAYYLTMTGQQCFIDTKETEDPWVGIRMSDHYGEILLEHGITKRTFKLSEVFEWFDMSKEEQEVQLMYWKMDV